MKQLNLPQFEFRLSDDKTAIFDTNQLPKRPDILSYDRNGNPLLLIECKSYDVNISKSVFTQVSVYNKVLKSPYVVVTNGLQHFCWHQHPDTGEVSFLDSIPEFQTLMNK